MQYQITLPVVATVEKQADELERMLRHAGTVTLQFVTVAGSYKTSRARLTLLTVPDRVAVGAERALAVLVGRAEGVRPSAALRRRAEWRVRALLEPSGPDVPPLDGTLLDGWDSACLTVVYRVGRVRAELVCCAEDAARLAALKRDGWRVQHSPNAFQRLRAQAGRPWRGVPSLAPVPGALLPPEVAHTTPASLPRSDAASSAALPAAPVAYEQAFTSEADGLLLGVTPSGSAVRLARRALTLAVCGPAEAQQRAALALIRHGIAAGLGVVVALDRARVPVEALSGWEPRLRRLDVQAVSVSAAIPWRMIAPDLLAQAIGGPAATLPVLPARLGAVFDTLETGALRVPAVLGLATMPGDDLRRVMAEGGMLLVPQDGDAASTVVARLLLAYLATPPAIGRGVLLVVEAGLVPPDGLRQQVIQVVLGAREDALLELRAAGEGWTVCGPDGALITELLPDLLTAPSEGAGALVDSIVRDIGEASTGALALAEEDAAASAGGEGWWASGTRVDDLAWEDAEPSDSITLPRIADAVMPALRSVADVEPSSTTSPHIADAVAPALGDVADVEPSSTTSPRIADDVADAEPSGTLPSLADGDMPALMLVAEPTADQDTALGRLLDALLSATPADEHEALLVTAVLGGQFAEADAAALAWAMDAPQPARAWLWRVVLAEADLDRAVAAWRALQADPADPTVPLVRAVLAAMDAAEPAAWLAGLGDAVLADVFDEVPEEGTCDPPSSAWPLRDSAAAHEPTVGFLMPAAGNGNVPSVDVVMESADEPAVGFLMPAAGNEIAPSTGTPMEPEREALVGFVMRAAGNGTAPSAGGLVLPADEPAVGFLLPAAGDCFAPSAGGHVSSADEPAVGFLMPAAGDGTAAGVAASVLPAQEPTVGFLMPAAGNGNVPSVDVVMESADEPAVGFLLPAAGDCLAPSAGGHVSSADEPAVGFLMPAAGNGTATGVTASVLPACEPAAGFLMPAAGDWLAPSVDAATEPARESVVGVLTPAAGDWLAPSAGDQDSSAGEPTVGFLMPAAGNERAASAGVVIELEREPAVGFLMPAAGNCLAASAGGATELADEPTVGFLMPAAGNERAASAGGPVLPVGEPMVGVQMFAAGNEIVPSAGAVIELEREPTVGFLMPAAGNGTAPSADAVIEPEREPAVGFLMPAAGNRTAPRGDAALEPLVGFLLPAAGNETAPSASMPVLPAGEPAMGFLMLATGNGTAPSADAVIEPERERAVSVPLATNGADELNDDTILAAWQGGESLPQLVARLVATGVAAATARARIRAIVAARPPAMPSDRGAAALAYVPTASTQPTLNGAALDDAAIWAAWQAGTKTDDLVYAICGARGGTKIEVARERIYRVVVPQLVAALGCADLVDRLVAGEAVTADPRYASLMQQLARSPQPPAGHLERTLTQRLIRIWQERW